MLQRAVVILKTQQYERRMNQLITIHDVEQRIHTIRGVKVMLDMDLA
jgi:hypothetical protein